MNQNQRYFLTGLFVLTAFLLFAFGCILFGGSEILAEKLYFETYFASSVQGLDEGSAVKFRGVPIGTVESIGFVGDQYEPATTADASLTPEVQHQMLAYIRVCCSIDRRQFPFYTAERLTEMVQQGLRTSLGMQGITGIVFVNLDYGEHPQVLARDLKIAWTPATLYVPSTPTVLQTIVDVAEDLCEKLGQIDLSKTITALTDLAEHVDRAVSEADLPRLSATFTTLGESLNQQTQTLSNAVSAFDSQLLSEHLRQIAENMSATTQTAREMLPQLSNRADATMLTLQEMLDALKGTLGEIDLTVTQLRQGIDFKTLGAESEEALTALARAATLLEALVEEVREQPSRLIFDNAAE